MAGCGRVGHIILILVGVVLITSSCTVHTHWGLAGQIKYAKLFTCDHDSLLSQDLKYNTYSGFKTGERAKIFMRIDVSLSFSSKGTRDISCPNFIDSLYVIRVIYDSLN